MTSGAPLPGTRLRPVGDSMTRPGEEQGPGRCDAHQCRWPGRCEPRARRLRLLLLSGRPDTNEGRARTLANAAPGPCPQCGAGGPRPGPDCQGRRALGPHGSRTHLARGWQQGAGSPFLSMRRALSSRALLPPQTVALRPLPPHDTGQKGRSHALHSSARERALGWEEGEGKGREQGLGHSKHHLRAERTDGPTGM